MRIPNAVHRRPCVSHVGIITTYSKKLFRKSEDAIDKKALDKG